MAVIKKVILFSPGAGLGHLTRAAVIAMEMRSRGVDVTVVTNSAYAPGLACLCGVEMVTIATSSWQRDAPCYAQENVSDLIVLDTFPMGFRGEWLCPPKGVSPMVHLARKFDIDAYLLAVGSDRDAPRPFRRAIAIEPLNDELTSWLSESDTTLTQLNGYVRFPAESLHVPVPPELDEALRSGKTILVVHSGPEPEVRDLIYRAEQLVANGLGDKVIVISPHPLNDRANYEYFPAARLYSRAAAIVSGAGYNAIAEATTNPTSHHIIPFPRRYDRQCERLTDYNQKSLPSPPQATAQTLCNYLLA